MQRRADQPAWEGRVGTCPVAGAPISWGVCEVPGWGPMADAETVLSEMSQLGLRGTELGAPGFLPADPQALHAVLARHRLALVGSFVPLVLHEPDLGPTLELVRSVIALLTAAGGEVLVGTPVQDMAWSPPQPLDDAAWARLSANASRVAHLCADHDLTFALHPHVDTLVLESADVARALAETDVGWCLDTGHLMIGGTDPARFAREHGDRVTHVHLKDVDAALAADVRAGRISLLEATRRRLFTPLGRGAAQVGAVLEALEMHGYDGWLVLEQDTTIATDEPAGDRQPMLDATESIRFLQSAQRREEINR